MKSRPILFSTAMVKALLSGDKTQTRRKCKQYDQCPYGKPGDQLWVRESYYQKGHWEPVAGVKTKGGRQKWKFVPADQNIVYHIRDCGGNARLGRHHQDAATVAWHKRLARFMPRSASRTTLEITCVSMECLHDISEEDAGAEGCGFLLARHEYLDGNPDQYRQCYRILWDQINGPGSWAANPYVWALEFKVLS